jgi:hypothetical protein
MRSGIIGAGVAEETAAMDAEAKFFSAAQIPK